jgi:hypothetical protein
VNLTAQLRGLGNRMKSRLLFERLFSSRSRSVVFRQYFWRCLFRQTWIFDTNDLPATWVGCHVGLVAMMVAEVDEAKQIRNVVSR